MKSSQVTFAELDRQKGIPAPPPTDVQEHPLPKWYRSIREVPLSNLSTEDICKACGQRVHLEHIVPIALVLLQQNLLTGEMYDGELLFSLTSVPSDYWNKHINQKSTLQSLLHGATQLPASVSPHVQELLARLK